MLYFPELAIQLATASQCVRVCVLNIGKYQNIYIETFQSGGKLENNATCFIYGYIIDSNTLVSSVSLLCFWYNTVHPGRQRLWKQLSTSNTRGPTRTLSWNWVKSYLTGRPQRCLGISERARWCITISECHTYKDQSI